MVKVEAFLSRQQFGKHINFSDCITQEVLESGQWHSSYIGTRWHGPLDFEIDKKKTHKTKSVHD